MLHENTGAKAESIKLYEGWNSVDTYTYQRNQLQVGHHWNL